MESELNQKIRELLEWFEIDTDKEMFKKHKGKWNLIGFVKDLVEEELKLQKEEIVEVIKNEPELRDEDRHIKWRIIERLTNSQK